MSFYNEEKYIENSIRSILQQSYHNFELILINDYSTDFSLKLCQSFTDDRIIIYSKTNEPKGLGVSRNLGIKLSKGEYMYW